MGNFRALLRSWSPRSARPKKRSSHSFRPQVEALEDRIVLSVTFDRVVVDASSPSNPWMKQTADLNGDGFQDLMVAGDNSDLVWYSYSPSGSTWTKHTIAANVISESGSAVGNIFGDGIPDIVIGNEWFENPRHTGGNAQTDPWLRHALPTFGTHDILLADLNNDGQLDIVGRDESSSPVTILIQNSPLSWSSRVIDPGYGFNGLAAADLNQDGNLDLIVGGVWMQNPGAANVLNGTWANHTFTTGWPAFAGVVVGDINGDTLPDIALTPSEVVGKVSWFQNPGGSAVNGLWSEQVVDTGLDSAHRVSLVDVDLNGTLDVMTSEFRGAGRVLIYFNNGGGSTWTRQVVGSGEFMHNAVVATVGASGAASILGVAPFGVNPVVLYQSQLLPVQAVPKVLIYDEIKGFFHGSIPIAEQAIQNLGNTHGFAVDISTDQTQFTDLFLAPYQAIIWNNPSAPDPVIQPLLAAPARCGPALH